MTQNRLNRKADRWLLLQGYLVALTVGVVVGVLFREKHPLVCLLFADIAGTLVIFLLSFAMNNTSFYDPYWSVAPPFLLLGWVALQWEPSGVSLRVALLFLLVSLWAARLTFNFLRGWRGFEHEDWRYVAYRKHGFVPYWLVSFFGFHYFPTFLVFLGSLSFYAVSLSNAPLGSLDLLAAVVTLVAILVEAVSDQQLRRFVQRNKNPEAFLKRGLWRYSRHPNYFGEILFWVGCWLFAYAASPQLLWTLWGPVSMWLLFTFVSIPMIDKRMVQKRPAYAEHKKRVNSLVPGPVKSLPAR